MPEGTNLYAPVQPVFDAMLAESIKGVSMSDIVGGWDPLKTAEHFMAVISKHAGLNAHDSVLDIGCGCGRLAATLTQHLSAGTYCGVDIVPGMIDFCRRHIAARFDNFRFLTLAQANVTYDWYRDGTADIERIDEACAPESIDICIATSLFTHLTAAEAKVNLEEIRRALKPDGRAFLTFFLLDPGTRYIITQRQPVLKFQHRTKEPGVFIEKPEEPSFGVAYNLDTLSEMIAGAGLYVERILYGGWPERPVHESYQDVVIVRRH